MATHSSILAWETPWAEEPGGLQSMRSQESDMTEWLNWTELNIKIVFKIKSITVDEWEYFIVTKENIIKYVDKNTKHKAFR